MLVGVVSNGGGVLGRRLCGVCGGWVGGLLLRGYYITEIAGARLCGYDGGASNGCTIL